MEPTSYIWEHMYIEVHMHAVTVKKRSPIWGREGWVYWRGWRDDRKRCCDEIMVSKIKQKNPPFMLMLHTPYSQCTRSPVHAEEEAKWSRKPMLQLHVCLDAAALTWLPLKACESFLWFLFQLKKKTTMKVNKQNPLPSLEAHLT